MQPSSAPRCAIFDCDGTLVDSEHLGNLALARCLAELGLHEDVDDLVRRYRGGRLALILRDLEQVEQALRVTSLGAQAAAAAAMRCYLFDPSGSLAKSPTFGATLFDDMSELPDLLAYTP